MITAEWITFEQLKNRCNVEDFEILKEINDDRLHAFDKKMNEVISKNVAIDKQEADRLNQNSYDDSNIIDSRSPIIRKSLRWFFPPYIALTDCIFKTNEVFNIWNDKEKQSDVKVLTCNSILKQPIFNEVLNAMHTLLVYCEKNRPGKRDEAWDICSSKHKTITKAMFESIWREIPKTMRRNNGQKDANIKPTR